MDINTTTTDKKTCRPRRRFTEEERSRHLADWKQSGLSAALYGLNHGLSAQQLYFWHKRAKDAGALSDASTRGAFVPVIVTGEQPQIAPATSSAEISVTLRHGCLECLVAGGSNLAELIQVLRAIKEEVFCV
jgi:transposase-like protein